MELYEMYNLYKLGFLLACAALTGALALAGCAAKKPLDYHFSGCKITRTWMDEQGNERKDCDCKNGKQVGWDAKTKLAIIRCE